MLPVVIVFIAFAAALSIFLNKLTIPAAITGGFIALFLHLGFGWIGLALLGSFFVMGSVATSWQFRQKAAQGLTDRDTGKRDTLQVLANGGIAGVFGLMAWIFPDQELIFRLMTAGSVASAAADTLSSELGNLYGSRFYNILGFKKDLKGENGVVSLEGSLFGLLGSILIAGIFFIKSPVISHFIIIVIAGTFGNIVDSVLGAAFERKKYIDNNFVNTANTCAGAGFVLLISCVL